MVRLFSCFSCKSTKVVQCSQNEAIPSRPRFAFQSKATVYRETIQTHELRIAELEHSEAQHAHDIGDLRTMLGECEAQLRDATRELDASRCKATDDRQIINSYTKQIEEVEHQVRENAGVIEDLRRQVQQCERRKQEDDQAIDEHQRQIEAQHVHAIGDLPTMMGDLEAQLRDTSGKLSATLQAQRHELREVSCELQNLLATALHGVAPQSSSAPSPFARKFAAERDGAALSQGWQMVGSGHVPTEFEVANASIFLTNSDYSQLLLVHSRKRGPVAWELPGGKVEEGETPLEAALRELEQEAGIKGGAVQVIGCCEVPRYRMLIYICVPQGAYLTLNPQDEYGETDGAWHFPLNRTNDDGLPSLTYEDDSYLYSWIAQSMLQGGIPQGGSTSSARD